jgi:hypothetical protein
VLFSDGPLIQSHNDYERVRPLEDALEARADIVEIDLFLVGADLWVGHDRKDLNLRRSLRSLYFKPLLARLERGEWTPPYLLIDFKTDGNAALPIFRKQAEAFRRFGEKAPIFLLSGSRPTLSPRDQELRIQLDGRFGDEPANWLTSADWRRTFIPVGGWNGRGEPPSKVVDLFGSLIPGRKMVRFWGAPDTPAMWEFLAREGGSNVVINTDRPMAVRDFLSRRRESAP